MSNVNNKQKIKKLVNTFKIHILYIYHKMIEKIEIIKVHEIESHVIQNIY